MEIHDTIAECMIFANHWVAKKIAESFSQCALVGGKIKYFVFKEIKKKNKLLLEKMYHILNVNLFK